MRKIIIIFFYILTVGLFFSTPISVNAQTCDPWICDETTYTCGPDGCTIECGCPDAGYYTCPPNYYACNQADGCCQIGSGEGGGGGGAAQCSAPQNINCPPEVGIDHNNWTMSEPTVLFCELGNAQSYEGTCNHQVYDSDTDSFFCRTDEVITHSCCPAGTRNQTTIIPGQITTVTLGPYDSGLGYPGFNCSPGNVLSTSCYSGNKWAEPVSGGNYTWCYYYVNCVQPDTYVYNCVPFCTVTSPSTPVLTSPSNGATVSTNTVNLSWNGVSQTWGDSCATNNNTFSVYIGTSPSSLALVGTGNSNLSSIPFTGSTGQTYYWRVSASNGQATTSSPTWSFTINSGPWLQIKDGDVTTANDISSEVPTGQLFDIVGLGGFAGVPVYGGTFNLSDETASISISEWHANTATTQSRIFNYSFFDNLIPSDVNFNDISLLATGGTPYSDGYEWFSATGDIGTSGDINIGSRKVILFVENGNFNINGKINLTDGVGFFGAFIDGDINIDSTALGTPTIEGVYLSDGGINTGAGTSQLHVRGSVASFGGMNLQRNLTNNTNPAELFEFAPDQMLLFPEKLMFRRTKWTEVAP